MLGLMALIFLSGCSESTELKAARLLQAQDGYVDDGALITVGEDAKTTYSLTAVQIAAIKTIIHEAARPATWRWDRNEKEKYAVHLQAFEDGFDVLAATMTEAQHSRALENEGHDIAAKLLVMARDQQDHPRRYRKLEKKLRRTHGHEVHCGDIYSEINETPRKQEWRLPMEYVLLRPHQPDEGQVRGRSFAIWHYRQDGTRGLSVDPREFPTLFLYLCRVSQDCGGYAPDALLENARGISQVIAYSPGKRELQMLLDYKRWHGSTKYRSADVDCDFDNYMEFEIAKNIEEWRPYIEELEANCAQEDRWVLEDFKYIVYGKWMED